MERILITGCAGFIGCHLADHFLKKDAIVVGIDNLSRNGSEENLKWIRNSNDKHFYFHKTDIRDFPSIQSLFKEYKSFDLIIHEAAQVAVTTSIANPREDFEVNAFGTFNMLEATRLYSPDAFFEFASTNKVYGNMDDINVVERNGRYEYADLPYGASEKTNLDFHSPYGCSKGVADQYVRDYSRIYGLKTVVLRQSCIYGSRQFGIEDQGWVAWFVIASILGKPVTIYGDGKQVRDVLWIDDLVEVYVELYKNFDKVRGQIFNVGGGQENILSLNRLVLLLKERGLMKSGPAKADWRAGDQRVFVSDNRKIHNYIGWKPSTSPQEGVERLIAWTLQNKDVVQNILS